MMKLGYQSFKEIYWLIPFCFLGLLSLALLRPRPEFPTLDPNYSRIIIDAKGNKVIVPHPLKGIIAGPNITNYDFLPKTHSPEMLVKIGAPKDRPKYIDQLTFWFFPLLISEESFWDFPTDIESVLAKDRGYVYFREELRKFGLVGMAITPNFNVVSRDEYIFNTIRHLNELIDRKDSGEALIENYKKRMSDFEDELKLETISQRPKALVMVCANNDWTWLWGRSEFDERLGFRKADAELVSSGRGSEPERLLAMDPDMIFLAVGDVDHFMKDPRWKGFKAVTEKRVYKSIGRLNHYTFDLDTIPHLIRWQGELAYPEHLDRKMRQLIREHFEQAYGYEMKDYELDWLLELEDNHSTKGYERFEKN